MGPVRLRLWHILSPALLLPLAVGCPAEEPVGDDDVSPVAPEPPRLEVTGNVPGQPLRLEFGATGGGQTATLALALANVGGSDLLVTPPEFTGTAVFDLADAGSWPQVIAPGEAAVADVAFSPVEDGEAIGHLLLESTDPLSAEVDVVLRGDGIAPRIAASPDPVDFGWVHMFCPAATETLYVGNAGRAPLTVTGAELSVFADPAEISLEGATPPWVLQPGDVVGLTLAFAPTVQGPQAGVLSLVSDDPSGGALEVGVSGMGVTPPAQARTWTVGTDTPDDMLDVLWVIDNSSSIGEEAALIGTNMERWFQEQIGSGLVPDWQIGVVTTDVGDGGALRGDYPILGPWVPDPEQEFEESANLGTGGSGIEQGFHNAWLALQPAATGPGGPNEGLLRVPAGLSIIFLSDEAEQSSSTYGLSAADYVALFQGLKAAPGRVRISDVSGGGAGCSWSGGGASQGADYVVASSMTGGLSASVCDADWAAAFADPAWRPAPTHGWLQLLPDPIPASIQVAVDGVPLPSFAWTWDPANGAVFFDPGAWPEPGEVIGITWVAQASCGS